jgi:hypothetical protein
MQRALTPKRQVTEVAKFLRQCGGQAKHSEILELVARLNGAQNWNALDGRNRQEEGPAAPAGATEAKHECESEQLSFDVLHIGVAMFDDEEPWSLIVKAGDDGEFEQVRELEDTELQFIQQNGRISGASVKYPRSDRYDIPDVASVRGFLDWLQEEQGLSSYKEGSLEFFSEDTGDDSPATCVLTVQVPVHHSIR